MRTAPLLPTLLLAVSMLGARPAAAEEAAPAPASAPEAPTVTPPAPTGAADAADGAFVDRDGDGLQDGQERRFRGRWKTVGGQGRGGECDGTTGRHGGGAQGGERGGERRQRGAP